MFNTNVTWLVLANTTKAQVYSVNHKEFTLLETLEHPESRLKSRDLVSDRAGRYRTDRASRGAFEPSTDAHEEVHHKFAKEVADLLENRRLQNQYQHIILCAEPHFYGLLNNVMSEQVRDSIIRAIEKDYIPFPKEKIDSTIKNILEETRILHKNSD